MDLSSLFNGIELKNHMSEVSYDLNTKIAVLEKLNNLQSKIENSSRWHTDSLTSFEKDLKTIDDIIFLIKDRDLSLSDKIKDLLNNMYNHYKSL